jgi:hypothetical protein
MQSAEEKLEIDGPNERQFHSVLYFPKGEALHYPGYLLAIEKSPQNIIGGPKEGTDRTGFVHGDAEYLTGEPPPGFSGGTRDQIRDFQHRDRKALFVSHIARYGVDAQDQNGAYQMVDHCFLYNAYKAKGVADSGIADATLNRMYDWRDCADQLAVSGNTQASFGARSIDTLYSDGLDALLPLETQLTRDVKRDRYTHIVVIVMGWNTSQDEAIRNFNDIAGNIIQAAYETVRPGHASGKKDIPSSSAPAVFRPLVVGVTWPSFWTNGFTNFLSYPNKADDADELGMSWLNVLLNRTLPCVLKSTAMPDGRITLRTVLIGHSFGARAATRALFSSPLLEAGPASSGPPSSVVDLAIGLQGAVSINRFVPSKSEEGAPYRDFKKLGNTHVVLTASDKDIATAWPSWYPASGSIQSYRKACDASNVEYADTFSCWMAVDRSERAQSLSLCPAGTSDCEGSNTVDPAAVGSKVLYVDTSKGITEFNSPGSGGGAHSDIYRLPMGRLLWSLISTYARSEPHRLAGPLVCDKSAHSTTQAASGLLSSEPKR